MIASTIMQISSIDNFGIVNLSLYVFNTILKLLIDCFLRVNQEFFLFTSSKVLLVNSLLACIIVVKCK